MGLGVTVRLPSGLSNNSLQGRSFHGAFFEDEVDGFAHEYRTGRMSVHFTSGIACLVKTTTRGRLRRGDELPGHLRVLGGGARGHHALRRAPLRGQICPSRRTLSITSSELGVQGFEDRLIGFLVKP